MDEDELDIFDDMVWKVLDRLTDGNPKLLGDKGAFVKESVGRRCPELPPASGGKGAFRGNWYMLSASKGDVGADVS